MSSVITTDITEAELEVRRKEALAEFKKDRLAMRQRLLAKDMHMALDAMHFGMERHRGLRKDGITPEFHHQMRISLLVRNLPDLMHREECIATAYTHDLIEDENVTHEELCRRFGRMVGDASVKMSKQVGGIKRSEEEIFDLMAKDPIASIVKPADRDDNMGSMRGVFTPAKRSSYTDFAEARILPLIKIARDRFHRQDAAYGILRHLIGERIAYERELAGLQGIS